MIPAHKPLIDITFAAGVSAPGWAWLTHANEIAQLSAAIAAVLSGTAAGLYYGYRFHLLRKYDRSKSTNSTDSE